MKKRVITILLALVLLCSVGGTVLASSRTVQAELAYRDIKITLDGQTLVPKDSTGAVVEPFIMDGTTYLPVRAVADALGLEVGWDSATSTVSLTSGGQSSGGGQGSGDQTASAMAAYRTIVGKADSYTYEEDEYGIYTYTDISYRYALVQMQTQNRIPALILQKETDGYSGNLSFARVFQYDPNSRTVIPVEGLMYEGIASAGGYRGIISAAADGNGIVEMAWSSGTGEGSADLVTVNGNSLSRVTVWSGMMFDDTNDDTNNVVSADIDWHEITDLSGLNG